MATANARMHVPSTTFCESCTAAAKCLFFTIEYMKGWTCRFPEPHELGTIDEIRSRSDCVLCSSILQQLSIDHVRDELETKELSPASRAKVVSIKHSLKKEPKAGEPRLEVILLDGVSTDISISIVRRDHGTGIVTSIMSRFVPHAFSLQKINPMFLTQWLQICEKEHGEHCHSKGVGRDMDIDLIDVERCCLVKATTSSRYIALSYVNGRIRGFETTRATRDLLSQEGAIIQQTNLSAVVRHAIAFAAIMGEKYLWVDTLCIVQDDPQNKHDQIARMDEIYTQALVTFVSLSGRGADEGLLTSLNDDSPSRHIQLYWDGVLNSEGTELHDSGSVRRFLGRVKKSAVEKNVRIIYLPPSDPDLILPFTRYETRGWTFQERILSSRIVFFSNWQLYARCRKALAIEHMNQWLPDIGDNNPLSQLASLGQENEDNGFSVFCMMARSYTQRKLSFKSDILNAFSGIARVLEREMATTFRFGLPEKDFSRALFWIPSSRHIRRIAGPEETQMPSWSWAGWEGQTHYLQTLYSVARPGEYQFIPQIKFVDDTLAIDGGNKGKQVVKGFDVSSNRNPVSQFETWTIPGDSFDYLTEEQEEEYSHTRNTGLDQSLDEPTLSCAILDPNYTKPMNDDASQNSSQRAPSRIKDEDGSISDDSSGDSDDEHVIGTAWFTHACSPLHEIVQRGQHRWLLLGKERGFMDSSLAFTVRPDDFPDEYLSQNISDEENEELPWMVQLMLTRYVDGFAERVAVAYLKSEVWDSMIAEKGEKCIVRLR